MEGKPCLYRSFACPSTETTRSQTWWGEGDIGQVCGLYQVDQSTIVVKEKFGKFSTVLSLGCHCVPWCCGVNVAGVPSLRIQQLDVQCETKSKDNVFVTVVASVQYRAHIEAAEDAFYKLTNPREQIKLYVFDAKYSSPCYK
ncbi:unnamed protein product [Sphagnum tenellum]